MFHMMEKIENMIRNKPEAVENLEVDMTSDEEDNIEEK